MTEDQVQTLSNALKTQFHADVEAEPVNDKGRYRFSVVSEKFEGVSHLQRQDELWKVVDAVLPREATLDISLILAYSNSEVGVHTGHSITGLISKDTERARPG